MDSDGAVHTVTGLPDGAVLVVYRQPMALDRFTAHDVTSAEPLGKQLRPNYLTVDNSFTFLGFFWQTRRIAQVYGRCEL